jgi:hypothetical protein
MLAAIFVFYTVPLTLIANLAAPENMKKVIPVLAELANVNPFLDRLLQGFVPALLNSLFFSLCPVMFKAIANFGSNAISVNQAEYNALQVRSRMIADYLCFSCQSDFICSITGRSW